MLLRTPEQTSMLLWASLLVLAAPVSGPLATVPKPMISLQPPWTTVFRGERVNLTCNGFHFYAPEKIKWYRLYSGRQRPSETQGNTLEVRDSGQYICQVPGSLPSNPVHLLFSTASFILQAPHSVFEGDELILRCRNRGREKLTTLRYFWNRKVISDSNKSLDLLISRASLNNSGCYQCTGSLENNRVLRTSLTNIRIQELFPRPKLKVTDSQPTEGNSVNLSCKTQLPLERSDTRLRFVFFRDHGVILSNWSASPELQVTAIWREDSGSYWCGAMTSGIHKRSLPLQIDVQRIPVSGVFLETQPQGDPVVEGEILVLVCSVAEGTGNTTFSWHREDTRESLGQKSQRSQRAELEIAVIRESHAGGYYCTADNGYGLIQSEAVNVSVRSTPGKRKGLVAAGTTGGTFSVLLAVALLFYCWYQRKLGDGSLGDTTRRPLTLGPGVSFHPMCPAPVELQQLYGNVHPKERDLVYSQIQIIQPGEQAEGNTFRTSLEDQHASIVYSEVKTQLRDDSAGKVGSKDEDIVENYKDVLLM
ncbi:Fc receptor-like protein 4 [Neophocaena asiaeorientalis asiaeorientalis]|uniref:Fc receptor-like protein 4 n=1 Tax=Neophocaena asiaeorientalis asiaeorientalis TaxID=1706337 RepID=A0A341BY67_NEOAA|nr:Fc receptor-like protein 4 [Neophocaena asiaeorientalis asiaeorientalis]